MLISDNTLPLYSKSCLRLSARREKIIKYMVWEYDHIFLYYNVLYIDVWYSGVWLNSVHTIPLQLRDHLQLTTSRLCIWETSFDWETDKICVDYLFKPKSKFGMNLDFYCIIPTG